MSHSILKSQASLANPSRRSLLRDTGTVTLSAATVLLLGGCETIAATEKSGNDPAADADILNVALGLEHEAINAYQIGAESGLLEKPVLDVAVLFQGHHKAHRDALAATIEKLGGTPVDALTMSEYGAALDASSITGQGDILQLAHRLEMGAANAYLGVIPAFSDSALSKIAGRIAADETMHWTVLHNALGMELPKEALSFGA